FHFSLLFNQDTSANNPAHFISGSHVRICVTTTFPGRSISNLFLPLRLSRRRDEPHAAALPSGLSPGDRRPAQGRRARKPSAGCAPQAPGTSRLSPPKS